MVIVCSQRRIELPEVLMKETAGYKAQWDMSCDAITLRSIRIVLPLSLIGILQPAGPEGPQRFLESL